MEKNNIKKQQNVYVSEEENTLNWLEVQNAFKKTFGGEIYNSWLQKISLEKEFNDYHPSLVIVQGDEPLIQKEHLSEIAKSIMKNPSGHAWNSISQLNSIRDLESKNIVKAAINKEGKIIYIFRVFSK